MKQVLLTSLKVLMLMAIAVFAIPCLFGFAAGLCNSLTVGYVAGCLTIGFFVYAVIATIVKEILRYRKGRSVKGASS